MNHVEIGDKDEILGYDFLPEEALRQVRNHESLAIWSYDDKKPVCCAVFTRKAISEQTAAVLQYIVTGEPYRKRGKARELINYSIQLLERRDVSMIFAFSQGDEPEAPDKREQDQFLKSIGFEEHIRAYQVLEYREEVLASEKLQPFMNIPSKHIIALTSQMRRRLLQMDRKMEKRLQYYFSDDTVSADSLAYVESESVRGAVILDDRTDYRMCIRYLYIDPQLSDKTIILKLLAAVASQKTSSTAHGNILIFAPEDRIGRLMEYFFGEPDKRYYRTMYSM